MPCGTYHYNLFWSSTSFKAPWGYWWTGAYCDLCTGPPWCPSWMDYAEPYFKNKRLLECPDWQWHKLGGCQWNNDRYTYGVGANSNVLRYWDFNGADGSIPGRLSIPKSFLSMIKNPSGRILLYDRYRSDRNTCPNFSNTTIGGVGFYHPTGYPRPPDNVSTYFTLFPFGSASTNAAFVDGHCASIPDPAQFNEKL